MDILAIIYRIKEFIVTGVFNFPLIIAMTSLVLVCATSNMGYTVLLACIALIVPIIVWIMNLVAPFLQFAINWIIGRFSDASIDFSSAATGVCNIARQSDAVPAVFPSYWMASVLFILSFTFYNGLALYNYDSGESADPDKVTTRKTHAMIGMIASGILALVFMVWRITTGCEHWFGILMALSFIGLGIGLFEAFNGCGLVRLVDLYGVGSRILPASATAKPTQVCFPVGESASVA